MKGDSISTSDLKSLAELREELDPQGDKAEKDDILGIQLEIRKIKPWQTKKGKMAVRVIAVRADTGELVHFNAGEPAYNGLKDYIDHVPFPATVEKYGEGDNTFYLVE